MHLNTNPRTVCVVNDNLTSLFWFDSIGDDNNLHLLLILSIISRDFNQPRVDKQNTERIIQSMFHIKSDTNRAKMRVRNRELDNVISHVISILKYIEHIVSIGLCSMKRQSPLSSRQCVCFESSYISPIYSSISQSIPCMYS